MGNALTKSKCTRNLWVNMTYIPWGKSQHRSDMTPCPHSPSLPRNQWGCVTDKGPRSITNKVIIVLYLFHKVEKFKQDFTLYARLVSKSHNSFLGLCIPRINYHIQPTSVFYIYVLHTNMIFLLVISSTWALCILFLLFVEKKI